MKKIFWVFFVFLFLPAMALGQGLVPCGNPGQQPCGLGDFFIMLYNVYKFIVWDIATPLAIVALVIGGIFMMISAGNPQMAGRGKQIVTLAIIGLALVFCSYLIIDFVLKALGYSGNWSNI